MRVRIEALTEEGERQVVERAERALSGEVRFLAHALVVPVQDSREVERYDAQVEDVAVRVALSWERERGRVVRDVSIAGRPDWSPPTSGRPGWRLTSSP